MNEFGPIPNQLSPEPAARQMARRIRSDWLGQSSTTAAPAAANTAMTFQFGSNAMNTATNGSR